jgi:putative membrane protein
MGYLSEAQKDKVSSAVAAAELETSGEIVTVLAERSDGYTDVALWWAVLASFTAMSVFALFPDFYLTSLDWLLGGWTHGWTTGEVLSIMLGIGLLKFLGVLAIQLWQPLKFFLVPPKVKHERVREAAIRHFKVGAERRTHGATGILVYLSMREHRAEIVADEAIAAKVPAEVWGEAMADMLIEIRQGRIAEGIAAGVRDVGKVLSQEFPRALDDVNELPDRLIEV